MVDGFRFKFLGEDFVAFGSGSLHWPERSLLAFADLHLGKSRRVAREGRALLPPFDDKETLDRMERDLKIANATTVACIGDSFDDMRSAGELESSTRDRLSEFADARRWRWIAGNHDPEPFGGGEWSDALHMPPFTFRHMAVPGESGEISGHYHPKASVGAAGRRISKKCFLFDGKKLILPAFGTYTGGLPSISRPLKTIMAPSSIAILTGPTPRAIPMPR
ncbi:MAG: ligase-associated DNA damage response endonuclease PdeM [Albidovulum sp.]|nr:ligase-associated DNA damage response endonuclease PdeM [Albidovulum sp.]MDE0304268.1 ligase-associated DNA damage response endonuclease PdeM [Albidovulum sp.]MDE0531555.1 ligase-associated DNA damage response endonuclease PdeM [Albidovulum sp.]